MAGEIPFTPAHLPGLVLVPDPQGSDANMNSPDGQYIKLQLGTRETTKPKWLIALRTTADHYGWTEQFEIWTPKKHVDDEGRATCFIGTRAAKRCRPGGRAHVICESPSKIGNPAGLTHQFRLSRNTTLLDIGELAHLTKQDWHWLTAPNGERWSRCKWEAVYNSKLIHIS